MLISRRMLAAAGAASLLTPRSLRAAETLEITPDTPTARLNSRYAKFANPGIHGRPKTAVDIVLEGGLKLSLWLPPKMLSPRPVVFSHAELALPSLYDNLLSHWASHGFAVLAPLHDDSVLEKGLVAQHQDIKGVTWDLKAVISNPEAWTARARTCRAVLDAIPTIERTSGLRMDMSHPIIAGHSFGAYVAQILSGARATTASGTVLSELEPRFTASLLLSPQGRGVLGLTDGSWDGMTKPSMVMTGNGDDDATGQTPAQKIESFQLSPPGNKHLAWFSSIVPSMFSGQQVSPGTPAQRIFQDLEAVSTAFLVAYGEYNQDVLVELAGDYYTRMTGNRITMQYR